MANLTTSTNAKNPPPTQGRWGIGCAALFRVTVVLALASVVGSTLLPESPEQGRDHPSTSVQWFVDSHQERSKDQPGLNLADPSRIVVGREISFDYFSCWVKFESSNGISECSCGLAISDQLPAFSSQLQTKLALHHGAYGPPFMGGRPLLVVDGAKLSKINNRERAAFGAFLALHRLPSKSGHSIVSLFFESRCLIPCVILQICDGVVGGGYVRRVSIKIEIFPLVFRSEFNELDVLGEQVVLVLGHFHNFSFLAGGLFPLGENIFAHWAEKVNNYFTPMCDFFLEGENTLYSRNAQAESRRT